MDKGNPLIVEYDMGDRIGWVKFYLAPKTHE
jgi:hypothetical protein